MYSSYLIHHILYDTLYDKIIISFSSKQKLTSSRPIDTFETFPRSSSTNNTFPRVDWHARICRSLVVELANRLTLRMVRVKVRYKYRNLIVYLIPIIPCLDPTLNASPDICSNDPLWKQIFYSYWSAFSFFVHISFFKYIWDLKNQKIYKNQFLNQALSMTLRIISPVAFAVVLMYRILFSFNAFIKELSPAISVGCGLKTSSISLSIRGSLGPSPSVSTIESPPPVSASALEESFSEFWKLFCRFGGFGIWFTGFGDGVVEFLDVAPEINTYKWSNKLNCNRDIYYSITYIYHKFTIYHKFIQNQKPLNYLLYYLCWETLLIF